MFRPESDWTDQNVAGVERFAIDRRFSIRGVDVDIRRFDWVSPCEGPFSPAKHYIDFSLAGPIRRSQLSVDAWQAVRRAGDILYLSPQHAYWGKPALERRRLLCIAISQEFIEHVFEAERPLDHLMPCADVQNPGLRRTLHSIAAELLAPGFASSILLEAMLVSAVVELSRLQREPAGTSQAGSGATDRQVRRIIDYVMDNLSRPLSIAEIARECGLSTRHVARVFKDGTGLSLGDFIAQSRTALAKELLASDSLRIKEVAWRCGFSSTSAFSAAFRAATAMTPRDYRQGGVRRQ